MFKWSVLALAATVFAATFYCVWPRSKIVDGKLLTPTGEVYYTDGSRAYVARPFEPPSREQQLEARRKREAEGRKQTVTDAVLEGDLTLEEAIARYGKQP